MRYGRLGKFFTPLRARMDEKKKKYGDTSGLPAAHSVSVLSARAFVRLRIISGRKPNILGGGGGARSQPAIDKRTRPLEEKREEERTQGRRKARTAVRSQARALERAEYKKYHRRCVASGRK